MSKSKKRSDTAINQLTLFDLVRQDHEERQRSEPKVGTLNVALQLQEIIDKAIGRCNLSRDQIAGRMSELTGAIITRVMLDAFTAPSKHRHRFPAEYLPALCEAVGSDEPLTFLARKSGVFTMKGQDVLRADLARKIEQREAANRDIKKIKAFLGVIDGAEE